MSDESAPPPIDSRSAFAAALRWAFSRATAGASRRIVCVDRDFSTWPLDQPDLHAELTAWIRRPQRQLVLLAAGYEDVPRRHPRFVAWRRLFAHAVAPFEAPAELAADLPTLFLDEAGTMVRLIDDTHWRGRASIDERSALPWRERIDAVLQRSEAAFPANPLGL